MQQQQKRSSLKFEGIARSCQMNATPRTPASCLWSRVLPMWPLVCCSMLPVWQLCQGDLVHKASFKESLWLQYGRWNMRPYGWMYRCWNELYCCENGGSTTSGGWRCLVALKFVTIFLDHLSSAVHFTFLLEMENFSSEIKLEDYLYYSCVITKQWTLEIK